MPTYNPPKPKPTSFILENIVDNEPAELEA